MATELQQYLLGQYPRTHYVLFEFIESLECEVYFTQRGLVFVSDGNETYEEECSLFRIARVVEERYDEIVACGVESMFADDDIDEAQGFF
jgi:hypothetical protein